MTTVTETLPTLTNIPSITDPDNFATEADNLLGTQLPALIASFNTATGQINTVSSEVNSNASTATTKASEASSSASTATTKASEAAASALTAINAPGTSATSATSLTVATGAQSLTIQTGKALVSGMEVVIAYTTDPFIRMVGTVTAYTTGTGALAVTVTSKAGTGTYADWTVSLTAAAIVSGGGTPDYLLMSQGVI